MATLDQNLIRQLMAAEDYTGAIELYISVVNQDDRANLTSILTNVRGLVTRGGTIPQTKLSLIKTLIDDYDESVQELAIDIYSRVLRQGPDFLSEELDFCFSMVVNFEVNIRDTFIDFLISIFTSQLEQGERILQTLIGSLNDDSWKIRMKIIEFFNKQLASDSNTIRTFKQDFLKILDERDLDVAREGMDFLFQFISMNFTAEDIVQLVLSIHGREWLAQEKILWLIGKIGSKTKELIEDVVPDLVNLLDYDDYLVQRKAEETITEIMDYFPDLFDSIFFSYLKNETLENINAIERLLSDSIHKQGYSRFFHLFNVTSAKQTQKFQCLISSFKHIASIDPPFAESLMLNLMDDLLEQLTQQNYESLLDFLKAIPQYNVYLTCYTVLLNVRSLNNPEAEDRRQELFDFLLSVMPELGYDQMAKWITQKIEVEPVEIAEICKKYALSKSQVMINLEKQIDGGLIDAVIIDDKVQRPGIEELNEIRPDLAFAKQWQIQQDPDTNATQITLSVKLTNISEIYLSEIKLFLIYPTGIFTPLEPDDKGVKLISQLPPVEDTIISWTFQKTPEILSRIEVVVLKLAIIYVKNGKTSSLLKKIDALLL